MLHSKMTMKRFAFLACMALSTLSSLASADLRLDAAIKQKQAGKQAESLFKSVVKPYADGRSTEFDSDNPGILERNGQFAWLFNGRQFISMIGGFAPSGSPLTGCPTDPDEVEPRSRCDLRRQNFWDCHLFMINGQNLKLESTIRLNVVSKKNQLVGLPFCLSIDAMAAAKVLPDAMLITLGYIDSYSDQEINFHNPIYHTTLLIRFSDDNGKLKIEQDDSCLGNPNQYETIAAARKALARCARKL